MRLRCWADSVNSCTDRDRSRSTLSSSAKLSEAPFSSVAGFQVRAFSVVGDADDRLRESDGTVAV